LPKKQTSPFGEEAANETNNPINRKKEEKPTKEKRFVCWPKM
jgi:hypothetical protein